MKTLTPDQLKAAKAELAKKCQLIADIYTPDEAAVIYRKSLTGSAYRLTWKENGETKYGRPHIEVPKPVTRKSLYIYLHECAHHHLGHCLNSNITPKHVREMEAEKWAHEKMRENGIAVPRSMTDRAKKYVARKIRQALVRGAQHIDPMAIKYSGFEGEIPNGANK